MTKKTDSVIITNIRRIKNEWSRSIKCDKGYTSYFGGILISSLFAIIVGLVIILVLGCFTDEIVEVKYYIIICIVSFIIIFLIGYSNSIFYINTRYQVTISDNVNFNEFNNKYKIISQDGKIYTVEERK